MTTATAPAVWCGRCGKSAEYRARTIDPRYPLVECGKKKASGGRTGCGLIAGLTDSDRAESLRDRRHRENMAASHDAHELRGVPAVDCPTCEAKPPTRKAAAHPWTDLTDRRQLVKHLRLVHGDPRDMTNPDRYPYDYLADEHRGMHP